MRRILSVLFVLSVLSPNAEAQKKLWADRAQATMSYMQKHMWNAASQNYVRRADQPGAPGSDAWGITIVLDAYAYMVEGGLLKPEQLKQYYQSSSALYEKTNGTRGARILAQQGDQIYVGGDDDLQWCAALVHCFEATKDTEYLEAAKFAFNALIDMGFWIDGGNGGSKGWAWNSADRRPNGVSTAYGALAAARLYHATNDNVYKQWAVTSLNALETPQVGFFPRDMMVAADAAITCSEHTKDADLLTRAQKLAGTAVAQAHEIMGGKRKGELNPTDVGDIADGLIHMSTVMHNRSYQTEAIRMIDFFAGQRTASDIAEHGFFSRYDSKGKPVTSGSYLGVPLAVPFLPEVAEMLKLFAILVV
ncbi:MAG: glycoside hydrolase family 76 protein [Bacteroidota bacterium]|nr:glycoside hydrolase family 76 protein [Bacteroidota bacterium]MDP4234606.1 glycoside hydrolase family 76 protein [Bacteroidota bacterium]MDP4243795.1 glycoside hydrolase family 76 protein [Bacteroidota bacterium]MDP4288967.1 glycoside hydrolase family 76 protein [Bacteroidota bacterium]